MREVSTTAVFVFLALSQIAARYLANKTLFYRLMPLALVVVAAGCAFIKIELPISKNAEFAVAIAACIVLIVDGFIASREK